MNQPAKDKSRTDTVFAGAMPEMYETLMVPLIFEPYAIDLADRLARRSPRRVLEIAAGTGVVTRRLAAVLPAGTAIVATDLNQAMLDHAASVGSARPVEWRQADAMRLPFEDGSFDAVVCQFGVMFFPDKAQAFAEARRVLAHGGVFLFNAWDRIEDNEFADTVTRALATLFPDDPPRFMARIPHGYHDLAAIVEDVKQGGFAAAPRTWTVAARSSAPSARIPAMAYCLGTPLRNEIEARDRAGLDRACQVTTEAVATRFGVGAVDGKIQAHIVMVNHA
jgi:SAM-dependent methyltransferase